MKLLQSNSVVTSLFSLAIFLIPVIGLGQAPQTVSYTGILTDDMDVLQANATVNLTFTLYDMPTGGTNQWTETHSGVTTTALGEFAVVLGSITPFSSDQFSNAAWLGIQVDANPEMTPRVEMTSVPSAMGLAMPFVASANSGSVGMNVSNLGGGPAAEFRNDDSGSGNQAVNVFAQGFGDALFVEKLDGGGNSISAGHNGTGTHGDGTAIYGYANGGASNAIFGQVLVGDGSAARFQTNDASSTGNTVHIYNQGLGPSLEVNMDNASNATDGINVFYLGTADGLHVNHNGTIGMAGQFLSTNASNTWPALAGASAGSGPAVQGNVDAGGTGPAGNFNIDEVTNASPVITANTNGTGEGITSNTSIVIGDNITNDMAGEIRFNGAFEGFDGGSWVPFGGGASFPLSVFQADGGTLLEVTNSGTGNSGVFNISNAASGAFALTATTDGTAEALLVTTSGTGPLAAFDNNNSGNGSDVLAVNNTGTGLTFRSSSNGTNGSAANFNISDPTNPSPAINVNTGGLGHAAFFVQNGLGPGLSLNLSNATNASNALNVDHDGIGSAAILQINNASNGSDAVSASTSGTGGAGSFNINNAANGANALTASSDGTGFALSADNSGLGPALNVGIGNGANTNPAVEIINSGTGYGIHLQQNNAAATLPAIQVNNDAAPTGILVFQQGTSGNGGEFLLTDGSNPNAAVKGSTSGTGRAGQFDISNVSNGDVALATSTDGTGSALLTEHFGTSGSSAFFDILNATNSSATIFARTSGTGAAGEFQINNGSNNATALNVSNNGTGRAFAVDHTGNNGDGVFIDLTNGLNGSTAVGARTAGTGQAGFFQVLNGSSAANAVIAQTNGTGAGILANRNNAAAGNVAIFQDQGTNIARITDTGLGIFEAGTQTGGADLAEAFEVEGLKESYEPGDVMVISTSSDRKLEKSADSYDAKVVGVYATKPGVLLTEYGVDDDISHTIPLGVVGVLPTKVCSEGGDINRGDLLVTSSTPGHAMKATGIEMQGMTFYPNGTIIGKALQDFKGKQGVIKVLVNVK